MENIKIGIRKVEGNDPYFYITRIDTKEVELKAEGYDPYLYTTSNHLPVNEVLINGIYLRCRFDEKLKLRAYSQYRTRENKEWEITLPFNAEAAIKMINEINDDINRPEIIEFDFSHVYKGAVVKDDE